MENHRIRTFLLGIIALVLVGFVLKAAQVVVVPLIIAWLLSYLLAPVINFMARRHVPPGLSVFLTLVLLLCVCYLSGVFIYARATGFVEEYPKYADRLSEIGADLATRFTLPENSLEGINWPQEVGKRLVTVTGSFVGFLSNLLMVFFFLVFMLMGKPYARRKIRHAFSGNQAERISEVTQSITHQISRYLSIKVMISAMTGLLVWALLAAIGVDFPVTWAVLAFLLNFIPMVGSILATIPPVLIALVQFYPNGWAAAGVLAGLLLIQQTMGSFLEPKLTGERLNLSPVVILISLIFWGWLWGIIGALLSVPIAVAIKIVCENFEALKPISVLMGAGKSCPKEA